MLINCRTTHDKKVPSFGSSSGSQTDPELGDALSSANAATQVGEGEKDDDENQTHSTSSTDEAEDTFLQGIIKDLCRGDQEDIKVDETAEGVSHYVTQENTLCRAKSSKGVLKH